MGRHRAVDRGSEELVGLSSGQRRERHAGQSSRPVRVVQLRLQPRRQLFGADGERDQHPGVGWAAKQRPEELDGCRVGPVEVVEDQHQRPGCRQPFQQLADRAVGEVTLVLLGCIVRVRELGQCREDVGQLGTGRRRPVEESWVEASEVVVEGIDEHLNGRSRSRLGGGACEHEIFADAGTSREFDE